MGHTGDTGDGFPARQIGNVDERVVERSVDVCNAEHELALCDLRTERDGGFFLGDLLLGRLWTSTCQHRHPSVNPDRIDRTPRMLHVLRCPAIYGVEHVPF